MLRVSRCYSRAFPVFTVLYLRSLNDFGLVHHAARDGWMGALHRIRNREPVRHRPMGDGYLPRETSANKRMKDVTPCCCNQSCMRPILRLKPGCLRLAVAVLNSACLRLRDAGDLADGCVECEIFPWPWVEAIASKGREGSVLCDRVRAAMTKFIAVIAAKAEDMEADMVAVAVAMTTDNDRKTSIIMADTRDEGIVSPSQPVSWPVLSDTSPSCTDVKIYNGNEILFQRMRSGMMLTEWSFAIATRLKCARTSVPATWLTVSHLSGPTLIQTITRCREQRARVEGSEQTEQFAQLAAAHQRWWHNASTLDPANVRESTSRSWLDWMQEISMFRHEGAALAPVPKGNRRCPSKCWGGGLFVAELSTTVRQAPAADVRGDDGSWLGFDSPFVEALMGTRLFNLQVVLAMEGLGYQMGFARCEKVPRQRDARSIAQFQGGMAIRALSAPVLAPKAKTSFNTATASSSSTSLLDLKNAEKQKWAKRLRSIAERVGDHAKPRAAAENEILSPEERASLQLLVFTSGAPSTVANHIRRFAKFEARAHRASISLYPITMTRSFSVPWS
ncbi:hypothetical protein AK812_SmicGene26837 [Symbiodinium microadriaticum]|uniref:Uncharacterized protein n=1 Tax=Symbiodinium microadriaticum TaxID=2951 RepID=A0A1Q9D8K8_SYMMI|nr:hypothetical protein AK812_SmicGene26837 [Symbiodinium microadriaticum]CAE7531834.1 unnamed protein product [Symbiodinium microadriaticum]